MNWIELKITTTTESIDLICNELYDLGITGIEISDKEDFTEFLENNRKYWDYVDEELERLKTADSCITLYFSDDADGKAQLDHLKATLADAATENSALNIIDMHTKAVKDEDWSENWKRFFKPIELGEKIVIVPKWEDVPDTKRIKFIINPGCSFGTGSHESTRMCIEEIEKNISAQSRVLDLGCGSGILSIIALLLGAKEATAVDIDPLAVETAYKNLALNDLPEGIYHGFAGDITSDKELCKRLSGKKYDIVLANIVADVIINLSTYVKDFMAEDGIFICSGIILERKDEVRAQLEAAGLEITEERVMGEWAAFTAR